MTMRSITDDEEVWYFVEEIQKDPTVCNNCFRRCREVFNPTHWLEPIRLEVDDEIINTVAPAAIRDSVPKVSRRLPVMPKTQDAQDRRVCRCGVFSLSTVMRNEGDALTKRQSMELGERLANRLQEKASGFNREKFRKTLWRYKSDEELSNLDDEVFKRATEEAI